MYIVYTIYLLYTYYIHICVYVVHRIHVVKISKRVFSVVLVYCLQASELLHRIYLHVTYSIPLKVEYKTVKLAPLS